MILLIRLIACAAVIFLASVPLPVLATTRSESGAISMQALSELRAGVYPLEISPDGSRVAFSAMSTNGIGRHEIWITRIQEGSAPVLVGPGMLPRWSPDGNKLAIYSDRSGSFQLWTVELSTMAAEQITNIEGGVNPDPRAIAGGYVWSPLRHEWSPDSRFIVFSSRTPVREMRQDSVPNEAQASPDEPAITFHSGVSIERYVHSLFVSAFPRVRDWIFWQRDDGHRPLPDATNQLFVVDVRTGGVRQLTRGPQSYFSPTWSIDGRMIFAASVQPEAAARAGFAGISYESSSLVSVNVADGVARELLAASATVKWDAVPSSDGSGLLFLERRPDGFTQASVISLGTNEITRLREWIDGSVSRAVWLGSSNQIVVQRRDGVNDTIEIVDTQNGAKRRVSPSTPAARTSIVSASSPIIAWMQDDPFDPLQIVAYDDRSGHEVFRHRFNPQTSGWNLGPQSVVRWQNSRGDDLEGVLILPSGLRPGDRVPVIVDVYPDTMNNFKGWPMAGNRHWSSRGFAVFFLTSRAPHVWLNAGRDESYSLAGRGAPGWSVNEDDISSGIDRLLELQVVDPNRMCIYGFSNGGSVAIETIARSHRFACAVVVAPALANWIRPALMGSEAIEDMAGGISVWSNPADYVRLSPTLRSGSIRTPTLVVSGDSDGDFLLNSIELFNGVRQNGTYTELVIYKNQGHVFEGRALEDFVTRLDNFFDTYLRR